MTESLLTKQPEQPNNDKGNASAEVPKEPVAPDATKTEDKASDPAELVEKQQTYEEEKPAEEPKPEPEKEKEADKKATEEPAKEKEEAKPEPLKLKAPRGVELDEKVLDAYTKAAEAAKLDPKVAQELVDVVVPALAARQLEQMQAVQDAWTEESKADKEFGGDKLNENLAIANKAITDLGTPELRTLLDETGIGNHPEVIRFVFRAGKAISEDNAVVDGEKGVARTEPRTFDEVAAALFPESENV